MSRKRMHLICNAHLDPVWLWHWQDGCGAAIATFRCAADLIEEYDGFIFCHNEALLYRWIEELEPDLFARIQRLVREGRWHIAGGWYLQPDCNVPNGESIVRQILQGKPWFREKFGVDVTTAVNFDTFGHSRGLVQILVKAGYDSYIFFRPHDVPLPLPDEQFTWTGYDNTQVDASRSIRGYNNDLGTAAPRIRQWLERWADVPVNFFLWGVGNHGGGPSREDLDQIAALREDLADEVEILHSTPEGYFADLRASGKKLPRHESDLNPVFRGCYTSMLRVKQRHRRLENEIYALEKMLVPAWTSGLTEYPAGEIADATRDMLYAEFHDILPGTCTEVAMNDALRTLDHGLEITARLRHRTMVQLASGQPKAKPGEIPVFVYNPHPFAIEGPVECEFFLWQINWDREKFVLPVVQQGGADLPGQVEKEAGNCNVDWGKRMVFQAKLPPASMSRFDCRLEEIEVRPAPQLKPEGREVRIKTDRLDFAINTRTGLVDRFRVDGVDLTRPGAFRPIVLEDHTNPWGLGTDKRSRTVGRFSLMSAEEGTRFAGLDEEIPSVRVIEDGPVRSIVEAVFSWNNSRIATRYKVPKFGDEVEIEMRVVWNEPDRLLKLEAPLAWKDSRVRGQVMYATEDLRTDGKEVVSQKWVAALSPDDGKALACVTECHYGSDLRGDALRISLLRSPAASNTPHRPVVQDRHMPRLDQGEHVFRLWFTGGAATDVLRDIDRRALRLNEAPVALSFYPHGGGRAPEAGAILSDRTLQVTAFKKAERGDDVIVRLFEPTGRRRNATLDIPCLGVKRKVSLRPFEIQTLRIDRDTKKVVETNLLEEPLES